MKYTTPDGDYIECTVDEYLQLKGCEMKTVDAAPSTTGLNPLQQEVWELLDHLDPNRQGVHYTKIAEAQHISEGSANQRLARIEKLGCAKKIRGGVFIALP